MPKQIEKLEWEEEFESFFPPSNEEQLYNSYPFNIYPVAQAEIKSFISQLLKEQKKEIDNLIAEEMLIANKEGTSTSRLTSLANKINNLNK